ncbi:nitrous oxide reductase accessory protein NosL [Lacinutrix neustonica]|uniref:Nitrous oxide reductase accessory protein NosL n=1 Tax=Lacinutrix neustonica TaxID=2980107 RepID=A0A9E8MWQ3_9FLAO|nr:nitrous oxide reductase accessory protein NosL [Lacinutrix neustonica]WAC02335.1 nitrous oxide reductase accessory protein NosL [Lacinutrix neustonica]
MRNLKHVVITLLLVTFSCTSGPKAIDYGNEGCFFCKMTIVDKVHAAEVVTKKGKTYTFDATECMVHFLNTFDTATIKLYLSNDYNVPESLIDATQSTFLISKNIPSPMGAYLSAFKTQEEAIAIQLQKGGEIYTWNELLIHLNK